ncbi:MAG: DUF1269 domain-containing protein [Ardenticatenaceae bacterium]|nr:DUF1269 domain-containing protein [Ardenticatenaceae bacterium]MCB9445358.1 DUF1269 domain-containing protein [Ardenticatenaceae bacterium]
MSTNSVIHVYESMTAAETAVRKLDQENFPIKQVSIMAQDMASEKEVHGFITTGDIAKAGVGTGAWVGGLFGILVGAAFIWVPGFGPLFVAGPFAAALLGGVEGAVAGAAGGGLLGALFGWGISKQHILKYEESLKAGQYLLIVNGSPEEIEQARSILKDSEAVETSVYAEAVEA